MQKITALSRIPGSMEVWFTAGDGSIQDAYWYEDHPWNRFALTTPNTGSVKGGITAVSRIPSSMETWWIGPQGSVEGAYWYEGGQWTRYQIAPPGSAVEGYMTSVSRIPNSMEIWWIGPQGSVEGAYWYEGGQWTRYQIAPPGSAAHADLTAVSRIPNSMEIWWIGPQGSVEGAYWYEGGQWTRYQIAPPGSAAHAGLTAISRIPNSMEIWWIGPQGSVEGAFWYEGGQWTRYQIAPSGSAIPDGIVAVSRIPNSMEIWWTTSDSRIEGAFWYEGGQWTRYPLIRGKKFDGRITSGGLAALGGWVDLTISEDGRMRWRGHAHDSGADGYDFGITALLRSTGGRALAFSHQGHVGGTFTSGSRNHDWDEQFPSSAIVSSQYSDFEAGSFQVSTNYSSDFGSAIESTLSFLGRWVLGSTPIGAGVGLIVFVGVTVGSLISQGSLVPGARIVEGVLWLAGPSNTLLALAASGIASAGSRTRSLTDEEYNWANNEVFAGSLPSKEQLVLTDTIGGGNRAFTFPRFDGKITLNMGPDAFDDPRQYGVTTGQKKRGEVFIHELVHAWQIAHTPMDLTLLADALASKICEVSGGNPYTYGAAGPDYGSFNLEQQAQIVSDWFAGKQTGIEKDINSPYFRYILNNIRTGQY
ncbi:hypothetical protein CN683_24590 [Bacillus toyonensis]|uniref:hypothetical protein n=1 Tax=Bacillus cereus group TaxID=86661 RepID=UPI000BF1605A|nr:MULTISPECIES: hypothetical protein [Bacillus cereus group]PEK11720.1 hypothetical protein CN683_24590 [Bacillus toyonensis]PFF74097.1 hypothetical protein CN341_23365 [Bacillus cereus]